MKGAGRYWLLVVVGCQPHQGSAPRFDGHSVALEPLPEDPVEQSARWDELRAPPASATDRCAIEEPVALRDRALGVAVRLVPPADPVAQHENFVPSYNYGDHAYAWLAVDASGAPMAESRPGEAPLQLVLRGRRRLRRKEPLGFSLHIVNSLGQAVSVLGPMDGSCRRSREPWLDLYLERAASHDVYLYSEVASGCAWINGVTPNDVWSIQAGASKVADEWVPTIRDAEIFVPGRYRLWVVYRMCSRSRTQGAMSNVELPANLVTDRVVSNVVELEVF